MKTHIGERGSCQLGSCRSLGPGVGGGRGGGGVGGGAVVGGGGNQRTNRTGCVAAIEHTENKRKRRGVRLVLKFNAHEKVTLTGLEQPERGRKGEYGLRGQRIA